MEIKAQAIQKQGNKQKSIKRNTEQTKHQTEMKTRRKASNGIEKHCDSP